VTRAARVVPDVASFSVDDGFWYAIPEHLAPDLEIGSIVRVPLSGRRVRGWVVEFTDERPGKLKDIAGISGSAPVFDRPLLHGLGWAAQHYVAPVSTLMSRATPPNLPRQTPGKPEVVTSVPSQSPLSDVVERSAAGRTNPVTAVVANWHDLTFLRALAPVFAAGQAVLVIAASVAEVDTVANEAHRIWGDVVATVDGEDDAGDTTAWEAAQVPPRLVIGTPKTASWHIGGLSLSIVLEESRRAMKDRQTPTLHVRDLMVKRSRLEGFNLVFYGPTPGVELLASGADVIKPFNRAWPLVEVVDRSDDQPGSGFLAARTVAAISAVAEAGKRVFVFTHRRFGFASTRCTNCRSLRTCTSCGARLGRVESCPKCDARIGPCQKCGGLEFEEMGTVPDRLVTELNRRLPGAPAAVHPSDSSVTVGTERDLAGLGEVSLSVAADVDGMLMGTGYRTTEEALRQLARLASVLAPGKGSRLMIQTARPDSLLVTTMRRGDPIPYLERVLVERAREGLPPSSEMIALEIRGDVPHDAADSLAQLPSLGVVVLGPMTVEEGQRWLLTGQLGKARLELRGLVGRWRDRGATVRVDADPIDF